MYYSPLPFNGHVAYELALNTIFVYNIQHKHT